MLIAVSGLLIGMYLYLYFHEYVHWAVGKLIGGKPNVLYDNWHGIPYPYAVEYKKLGEMPNWAIRMAGISPHLVWTAVTISYVGFPQFVFGSDVFTIIDMASQRIYSTPLPLLIFITASAGAGVSISPSDLVATFRPDEYREYTGRGFSHSDWFGVLVER